MELKSQSGFSIIETVITLFIVGIVLVIYAVASNSVVLNANARHQEIAQRIALTEMETLRATAFGSLPASAPFPHALLTQLPQGQANRTVLELNTYTKQLAVTVSWQEPGGQSQHFVTFTTYKTRTGL